VYGTKCGYFSNVENCRPATACVVDMYIDDKANLPWNNKARYASMYGPSFTKTTTSNRTW
jgi:hypothetical protein